MSTAGSDFCALLLFGYFYSFEIFWIGNSAKTRGEKNHGDWLIPLFIINLLLFSIIALKWTLCTSNFLSAKGSLTHIVGEQMKSSSATHPCSLSSKLINEKHRTQSVCHTKLLSIQEITMNVNFKNFYFTLAFLDWTLNFVILYPGISLFSSSKILKCRNRVGFYFLFFNSFPNFPPFIPTLPCTA